MSAPEDLPLNVSLDLGAGIDFPCLLFPELPE
jgi:hypothetical protein